MSVFFLKKRVICEPGSRTAYIYSLIRDIEVMFLFVTLVEIYLLKIFSQRKMMLIHLKSYINLTNRVLRSRYFFRLSRIPIPC